MPRVEVRPCTVAQMLQAMARLPDDTVFRWFAVDADADPNVHYMLTLGQLRAELGGVDRSRDDPGR